MTSPCRRRRLHGLPYVLLARAGVLRLGSSTALRELPPPRASPFGSVVTGSLGLPSGLPFAAPVRRAGSPDMSRSCLSTLAGRRGKLHFLPDKEFRSALSAFSYKHPGCASL